MRAALAAVGRSALALVLVAATGAVVAAGVAFPTPDREPVAAATVGVPAQPTTLVCPGPLRLPTELQPGDDAAYDPQFDTAPQASATQVDAVTVGPGAGPGGETGDVGEAGDGTLTALGGTDAVAQLVAAGDDGSARVSAPTGPLVLRADAVDDAPAWVAGTLHVRTGAGDLRGLVVAPCQAPAAQSWLVGGSTHVGSSARLVLQNPGLTPASVVVHLWGPTGPVELAGAPEYLVPPGRERVVLLEGVAAEQSRIVVQTTASGGLVTAYLQDSRLEGLTPTGVDDVVAGTAPATRQVVPGISVAAPGAKAADAAAADRATGTVLRLLAPGDVSAHVGVTLLGPEGPTELPGGDVTLGPGTVLDVPLDDLAPGDYTALVTSDEPVVAAAMVVRGAVGDEEPQDRAWIASAAGGAGPVALPDGVDGRLVIAVAPDDADHGRSPVVIEGADGTRTERMVEEGATLSIPLDSLAAGGGLTVRTQDPRVTWSVVLEDDAMISVLVPVPPRAAQPQVAVEVR